jgi:transposase
MSAPTGVVTADLSGPDLQVVAGVDTHKDTHHVAVLALNGARLGDRQVPATAAGYAELADYAASFGQVAAVGVEGTGSYGAGLARHLRAAGLPVVEVIRPKRAQRRRGKSDPIDAHAAATQTLADLDSGLLPTPKTADGTVEQIRYLLLVRRSAVKARQAAVQQVKNFLVTAPQHLRDRFTALKDDDLITTLAATRPAPATESVEAAAGRALRVLARRYQHLSEEITDLETDLTALTRHAAPALVAAFGIGTVTAAELLVAAGDNPERLRSDASFAALAGAAPIPASSGQTNRHRLNRGGDRRANWALHQIALVRWSHDPRTRDYAARLRATGKSTKDILRCLKRALAREVWHLLVHPEPVPTIDDLRPLRQTKGMPLRVPAEHFSVWPATISEIERGTRRDDQLAHAYRQWLLTA